MDDKKNKRTESDLINPGDKEDVKYWSGKFCITPEQLKKAMKTVGSSATEIKKYLEN